MRFFGLANNLRSSNFGGLFDRRVWGWLDSAEADEIPGLASELFLNWVGAVLAAATRLARI